MNDRLQPAILGGLVIGVLSALPIVNAGNCCCCLWVIAGGVLAAYLRQQNSPVAIDAAEGALVGLLAGAIGGVVASILSIPAHAVVGPWYQQLMEWIFSKNPDIPSNVRDMFERASAGPALSIAGMIISIIIDVVFGTIGGLLGVAIFKKNTPPPAGTVEVLPAE